MKFELIEIMKEFDRYKSVYDFFDYSNDMIKIQNELNSFNRECAEKLVSDLVEKYNVDLNNISVKLNTGRTVVLGNNSSYTTKRKTDEQIRDDLSYLYKCIPLSALLKFGIKKLVFGGII